jgi:hypothetical protein
MAFFWSKREIFWLFRGGPRAAEPGFELTSMIMIRNQSKAISIGFLSRGSSFAEKCYWSNYNWLSQSAGLATYRGEKIDMTTVKKLLCLNNRK